MMPTFTVEGHYIGKVLLRVAAIDLADALRKFEAGYEDDVEVSYPMGIEPDYGTLKQERESKKP